ncbi:MAG: glutamate-1-semialdehyde 2,1-aminomutase [Chloroflexi bacterium]|nr:glutamate-1-semialdehyde 2,1-aminomutase [Chloroflexota bacterium]
MNTERSQQLFSEALELFPGGVNSPVRAFRAVGGTPRFIERGQGAYMVDVDGNRYIDYVLSWGPLILGHAHPRVVAALIDAVSRGTSYGAPNPYENHLAKLIQQAMPKIEMLRFVNSGTEATMSALRLARAFTGRNKIIKFEGCYHGHADMLLVKAGSGVATLGLPDSPGVPAATVSDTMTAPFNDIAAVEQLFAQYPREIAAIIVEPVAGNMGVVPPADGYLHGLRDITSAHGSLLIFDEVMTGFRVHPGGAQALFGISPDLTALGKVIGGGLPVGAYGGRRDIMQMVAPAGPMYQAGTLSGNPLAMVAGIETLSELLQPGVWDTIQSHAQKLGAGIAAVAQSVGVPVTVQQVGTMSTVFFTPEPVANWTTAKAADTMRYAAFFLSMLESGVYLAPSQFEAGFMSSAHSDLDIDHTIAGAERALTRIARMR